MKKLSIEQKAKRFDEAIKKLHSLHDDYDTVSTLIDIKEELENIFPELKESQGGKIRERLIAFLSQCKAVYGDSFQQFDLNIDEALSWLEKQDISLGQIHYWTEEEIEPIISDYLRGVEHYGGMIGRLRCLKPKSLEKQCEQKLDGTFVNVDDVREDFVNEVYRVLDADPNNDRANQIIDAFDNLPTIANEKQGEQKSTDKIEPKFKVGDWVVNNRSKDVFLIKNINSGYCSLEDTKGNIYSPCENPIEDETHLWTIQDAKDGDVLYMDNGLSTCTFIYKSINNVIIQKYASYNKFGFEGTTYLVLNDGYVCPATKEQRDTLFEKIKEAGYEWDAEKKELEKIELNPVWSEEDEKMYTATIFALAGFMGNEDKLDWLKSLKERVQPQPKQEWSKDDRKLIDETCNLINTLASGYGEKATEPISFAGVQQINSIKTRLRALVDSRPQNTWKPSEEMLEALYRATPKNVMELSEDEMLLGKLYQCLKYGILSKD